MVSSWLSLEDLDECVLKALELLAQEKLPTLPLNQFRRPLVVGSGNAAVTGKILFQEQDAVFATEGNYLQKLETAKNIDGAILISSSGGKHAPGIALELQRKRVNVVLLTNNTNAPAATSATKTIIFPKRTEPYTYNTSTYMGMILAKTKEKPEEILQLLAVMEKDIPKKMSRYNSFFILLPERFEVMKEMFLTKFDELFGPKVSARVCTPEQAKHAKTVVPSETELFIGLGYENNLFGPEEQRWDVPVPKEVNYAMMMALGYFIIGHIQKQHPPYFKKNIEQYAQFTSTIFGQQIKPLVE